MAICCRNRRRFSTVGEYIVESKEIDSKVDKLDEPTYCKVCEEVHEEMEITEDLSDHIVNNHDKEDVLKKYGQEWINQ